MIKVHGGTRGQGNLCRTCTYAHIRKGTADGQETISCTSAPLRDALVKFPVVECSHYYNKTLPSLSDLYEAAWILETSKNKRTLGFTPWKEYQKKNPDDHPNRPMGF